MLTIDDLRARLQTAAQSGAIVCDAVVLDAAAASFLEGLLDLSPLTISTPVVTQAGEQVTVSGTAIIFGEPGLLVTLNAGVDRDGAILLTLEGQMPASWRLTNASVSLQNSGLDAWCWTAPPNVAVTSYDHLDAALGVVLRRGLNVLGECPVPASLGQLSLLVGSALKVLVTIDESIGVTFTVIGQQLAITLEAPDFDVCVATLPGVVVSLDDVAAMLLPGVTLPTIGDAPIRFEQVSMLLAPRRQFWSFAATATPGNRWTIGPLDISGISVDIRSIGSAGGPGSTPLMAFLKGAGRIGSVDVDATVDLSANGVTVSASLWNLNLAAVGGALKSGFGLPDFLPAIEIPCASIVISPQQRTIACQCRVEGPWNLPGAGGAATLEVIDVSLQCDLATSDASFQGALLLTGSGGALGSGLAVKDFNLCVSVAGFNNWSVSGYLTARCFDTDVTLDAGFDDADGQHTLTLSTSMNPPLKVFGLSDVAWLETSDFTLTLSTRAGTAKGWDAAGHASSWNVGGTAHLKIGSACNITGSLTLSTGSTTALGVSLTGEAVVPLPWPSALGVAPKLVLTNASLAASSAGGQWTFGGSAGIEPRDWPASVQQQLGTQPIVVTLAMDANGVTITTSNWQDSASIPLPPMKRGNAPPIPLGSVDVGFRSLSLQATRDDPFSVVVGCAMTLPAGLNGIFGTDALGKPVRTPLRTGTPLGFTVSVGLAGGEPSCGFALDDSPLNMFAPVPGRPGWWHCDFGPAGTLDLQPPQLHFKASSFSGSTGFEQHLQIPVGWIRDTIGALAPAGVTLSPLDNLPAAIPLSDIRVYDPDRGLDSDALVALMRSLGVDEKVCSELQTLLTGLKTVADALPDRFLQYLAAGLPTTFSASLEVTPTGDVTVSALAGTADKPEYLYCLLPVLPSLVGIKLHELSFGPTLGGALCKLTLDAEIDFFDLTELAASAVLGNTYPPLKAMRTTFVCSELMAFIVYETVVPIPLPLFFKELGVDYAGPLGTVAKSSVSFTPTTDFGALFSELGVLWSFFTDKTSSLPDSAPGSIHASLTLNESYLELPRFLGAGATPAEGKVLGVKGRPVFQIDLAQEAAATFYPCLAHLLNGIKFFAPDQLVRGIPIAHRSGEVDVALGPIRISAGWILTTETEFLGGTGLSNLPPVIEGLVTGDSTARRSLLATVPNHGPPDVADSGRVIAVIAGSWTIPELENLICALGIAGGGSQGFSTGLWMRGDFLDLNFELWGAVEAKRGADQVADAFNATASAQVSMDGEVLLAEQAHVDPDEVWVSGALSLPQVLSPYLVATGAGRFSLSNSDGCQVRGRTRVSILGFDEETDITIDPTMLRTAAFAHAIVPGWTWSFVVTATGLSSIADFSVAATLSTQQCDDAGVAAAKAVAGGIQNRLQQALDELWAAYENKSWLDPSWPVTRAEISVVEELLALSSLGNWAISIGGDALSNVLSWLGPVGDALNWLQKNPVAGMVTITSATFRVSLDHSVSSTVDLTTRGTFLGQPFGPLTFTIPLDGVPNLAAELAEAVSPWPVTTLLEGT